MATANRVVSMLKLYPDTQATLDALPLMKASYEKMNLTHLADQTAKIIVTKKPPLMSRKNQKNRN